MVCSSCSARRHPRLAGVGLAAGVAEELIQIGVRCCEAAGPAQASGIVACHHGAGPAVSAKFIKMGSMLCQIGNEMRMLTAATAEARKILL